MKKIFFFIFIIVSAKMSSQNNQFSQNAKWHGSKYAKYSGSSCYWRRDFNQYFNGDTVINGNHYFKLFETGMHLDQPGGQQGICPNSYYSYTQNTNYLVRYYQKKILLWSSLLNQETTFLDYNLNVGDTIMNNEFALPYGTPIKAEITSIDSVLINGNYLKRFYYPNSNGLTKYVIEKIGSIQGFILPYSYDFESGSSLNCYSENSTILYTEPFSNSTCDITIGLAEIKIDQELFSIFPNPTSTIFNISSKFNVPVTKVSIHDNLGQIVLKIDWPRFDFNYDLSLLGNGIYYVEIETKNTVITKKIVKQ